MQGLFEEVTLCKNSKNEGERTMTGSAPAGLLKVTHLLGSGNCIVLPVC